MSIDTKARIVRGSHDHAYWLADKIPALGDYAKEAAWLLCDQADRLAEVNSENERLREALIEIKALGDTGGWANQMKVVAEKALAAGGGA